MLISLSLYSAANVRESQRSWSETTLWRPLSDRTDTEQILQIWIKTHTKKEAISVSATANNTSLFGRECPASLRRRGSGDRNDRNIIYVFKFPLSVKECEESGGPGTFITSPLNTIKSNRGPLVKCCWIHKALNEVIRFIDVPLFFFIYYESYRRSILPRQPGRGKRREERGEKGKGAGVIGGSFKMKLKPPFFFSVIMKSYHLNQICRMESGLVGWVNRWGSLIKHRRRSYARGAAQTSINYYLIIKPRAINKNKRGHSWSIYGNSPGTRRREKGIWCDK